MEYALEIHGLAKRFPGFSLDAVSFSLPRGFIMGLIGANGAGKTTTIKLLLGLLRREGGEVRIFGRDPAVDAAVRARIGFVLEEPPFYSHLTVEQTVRLAAPFYPDWDEALCRRLCREFELPLRRRVGRLSRGTVMKVALVLALSHHADLLILDEPTTGLDPVFRREFLDHLRSFIQDERKAVLFSTHITSDLERIADYLTLMRRGRVVFSTSREEIAADWAIVKAPADRWSERLRPLLYGRRSGAFGFTALTRRIDEVRRELGPGELVSEPAGFDDIVHFLDGEDGDE